MGSAFRAEIWEKSARNSRTGRLPPRRMARKAKIRPVQTGKDVLHPNPSGGPKNGCPALLRDEFSGRRVCGLNFGVWAPVDGTPAKFSSSKSGKRGRVSLFHAEERFSGTVYVRTMALSMNSKPRSSGIPPNSSFRGSGRDVARMADQLSVAQLRAMRATRPSRGLQAPDPAEFGSLSHILARKCGASRPAAVV